MLLITKYSERVLLTRAAVFATLLPRGYLSLD